MANNNHLAKVYKTGSGKHPLVISRSGFASLTTTFSGDQSGSELFTLEPVSAEGYNWLQSHPDQEMAREAAGGGRFCAQLGQTQLPKPTDKNAAF